MDRVRVTAVQRRRDAAGERAARTLGQLPRAPRAAGDALRDVTPAHEARHVADTGVPAGHVKAGPARHLTHVGERVVAVADDAGPAVADPRVRPEILPKIGLDALPDQRTAGVAVGV